MAGTLLERELTTPRTGRVRFEIATPEDDAEIRRLLRANPTPGRISLSFERERDYFADAHQPGETKQTIVARDGKGLACVGSCTIRSRFVNGAPRRVGYLGGLRLDSRQAGRFDILRRGYEFFRELQTDAPADFYFTSIAGDNQRARQLLERGLPGMPLYEFVGEFVTVLLPTHDRQWQNQAGVAQTSQSAVSRISQSAIAPCGGRAQKRPNRHVPGAPRSQTLPPVVSTPANPSLVEFLLTQAMIRCPAPRSRLSGTPQRFEHPPRRSERFLDEEAGRAAP